MIDKYIDMESFVNNISVASESGKTQHILNYEKNNKHIILSYKTGLGQFKSNTFSIPNNIKMDSETFLIFGLFQAEASKSITAGTFQFSNSDHTLVKRVIEYFSNYWSIPTNYWSVQITYWRKDFDEKKEFIKIFWKESLGINNITISKGTEYRLSENAKLYGVASLRLNNKIAVTVILNLLNNVIKPLVEENNIYLGHYLTGLFEGDGTLSTHNNKFQFVGLSFNPYSDELDHYHKVLKKINVDFNKQNLNKLGRRYIPIKNWNKYINILEATDGQLFLNERNKVFIDGFLNNQYIKPILRLISMSNYDFITTENYSKKFNTTKRSALGCLKRLERLEYISCDRKQSPFKYNLTDKGKRFIFLIDRLEGVLYDN